MQDDRILGLSSGWATVLVTVAWLILYFHAEYLPRVLGALEESGPQVERAHPRHKAALNWLNLIIRGFAFLILLGINFTDIGNSPSTLRGSLFVTIVTMALFMRPLRLP